MVQNKKLAVVIPTYNEAKTIIKVYNQTKNIGIPVIVDDCSIDDTKKILKKKKLILFQIKRTRVTKSLLKMDSSLYLEKCHLWSI